MATTTTTTQTVRIQTEIIADEAIAAHLPQMVVLPHLHQDNMDGFPSLTKNYNVDSDLGAASGGTEGTQIATTTTLSYGTDVAVTPTEGVADRALITDRTVRRRLPGSRFQTVEDVLQSGDKAALMELLREDVSKLVDRAMEKVETDAAALLGGGSNSVGSTGVDITITNLLTARYTMNTLEPNRPERAFFLSDNQLYELEQAFLVSGEAGTLWSMQADAGFVNRIPDTQRNGFVGGFLRDPVYMPSNSVVPTANAAADVVGAYLVPGGGGPPTRRPGFAVFLEGHPLNFRFALDIALRSIEIVDTWEYAVAELDDSSIVSIITDAP